jgi:hypothetical protein
MTEHYQEPALPEVLHPAFDLEAAVRQAAELGYYFGAGAITEDTLLAFQNEVDSLPLEVGDHNVQPINAGKKHQVKQLHARFYTDLWDERVIVARAVTEAVADRIAKMTHIDPALANWLPNEVGYQKYRDSHDYISPHRDRRNDQILALTITISGSNIIRTHEPLGDPNDYSNLRQTDEFRTSPGSVMFLRAPSLGSGEQVIHSVLPPETGSRLILNLRMRPDILPPPAAFLNK